MSTIDRPEDIPANSAEPRPEVHIHNAVSLSGSKGWNILVTLLISAGMTIIAWQLSLSGFAEMAASGVTIFLVTLVSYMFKAGILRLPEQPENDDLAFTKSTLRRIYDEIQAAIVKSSLLKLVLFALANTLGFMILRTAVAFGIGLLTTWWIALAVGLIIGGLIIAQDQILAWARANMIRKAGR